MSRLIFTESERRFWMRCIRVWMSWGSFKSEMRFMRQRYANPARAFCAALVAHFKPLPF